MSLYELKLKVETQRDDIRPLTGEILSELNSLEGHNINIQRRLLEQLRDSDPEVAAEAILKLGFSEDDLQRIADNIKPPMK